MTSRAIVPLIDIVFLSLASLLGVMSQMELVESIEVDVSAVEPGSAGGRDAGEHRMVTLTQDGLTLDGLAVSEDELLGQLEHERVILRASRTLPTQDTVHLLGRLSLVCEAVRIEVRQEAVSMGSERH